MYIQTVGSDSGCQKHTMHKVGLKVRSHCASRALRRVDDLD